MTVGFLTYASHLTYFLALHPDLLSLLRHTRSFDPPHQTIPRCHEPH